MLSKHSSVYEFVHPTGDAKDNTPVYGFRQTAHVHTQSPLAATNAQIFVTMT